MLRVSCVNWSSRIHCRNAFRIFVSVSLSAGSPRGSRKRCAIASVRSANPVPGLRVKRRCARSKRDKLAPGQISHGRSVNSDQELTRGDFPQFDGLNPQRAKLAHAAGRFVGEVDDGMRKIRMAFRSALITSSGKVMETSLEGRSNFLGRPGLPIRQHSTSTFRRPTTLESRSPNTRGRSSKNAGPRNAHTHMAHPHDWPSRDRRRSGGVHHWVIRGACRNRNLDLTIVTRLGIRRPIVHLPLKGVRRMPRSRTPTPPFAPLSPMRRYAHQSCREITGATAPCDSLFLHR